jgi:hypothetical protein
MYYYKITSLIVVNGTSMADELPIKSWSKNHDTLKKKVAKLYDERNQHQTTKITFKEVLAIEESTVSGRYIQL